MILRINSRSPTGQKNKQSNSYKLRMRAKNVSLRYQITEKIHMLRAIVNLILIARYLVCWPKRIARKS